MATPKTASSGLTEEHDVMKLPHPGLRGLIEYEVWSLRRDMVRSRPMKQVPMRKEPQEEIIARVLGPGNKESALKLLRLKPSRKAALALLDGGLPVLEHWCAMYSDHTISKEYQKMLEGWFLKTVYPFNTVLDEALSRKIPSIKTIIAEMWEDRDRIAVGMMSFAFFNILPEEDAGYYKPER